MKDHSSSELQNQFVKVIDKNQGIIYKVAHAYCKDPDDQKDLVQEIIFQLWKSYKNYDARFKLSTWMYRIALNVSISYLRKNQVKNKYHTPFDDQFVYMAEEPQEDLSEELRLLRQFIQNQKRIDKGLLLLYLEGKSHKEIAEVLGISATNVGTRLGRLKIKLKNHLINNLK